MCWRGHGSRIPSVTVRQYIQPVVPPLVQLRAFNQRFTGPAHVLRETISVQRLSFPAVSHPRSPIEHKRAIVGRFCIHYEVPVPLELERSTAKLRYGH